MTQIEKTMKEKPQEQTGKATKSRIKVPFSVRTYQGGLPHELAYKGSQLF